MDSRILDELEACYTDELSLVGKDLGSLENKVVALMRELGRGLLQKVVSKQRNGHKGSSIPCSCGHWMRFIGYLAKNIHTLFGWITIERSYYYCPECRMVCFPYDQASGLGPECLSAGLAKACCMLAVNNSFSETSRMIEEVSGQGVSDKTIERVVHQVGSVVLRQQRESLDTFREDRQLPACDAPPKRLYIAADGTTVHEQDGWHESKVGCIYWEDAGFRRQERYMGSFDNSEQFGWYLWLEACRCGLREAKEIVYLGDGAAWIRSLYERHFKRATFIVDWYHAQQHIWDCAKVLFGEGSDAAARWARWRCGLLWEGWTRRLLKDLAKQCKSYRGRKRDVINGLYRYISVNEEQMRYDVFRAKGYQTGSGPVEGACKHVVGDRLKRSGMIWSPLGDA